MKQNQPIKILGAISLDNEFIREYTNAMKNFSKTFKPLPNHSIIEKQYLQYQNLSSMTKSTNTFNKKLINS